MIKTFKLKDLKFMEFNQCIPNPLFVNQILVLKCNPISSNLEIGIGQYFFFFFFSLRKRPVFLLILNSLTKLYLLPMDEKNPNMDENRNRNSFIK